MMCITSLAVCLHGKTNYLLTYLLTHLLVVYIVSTRRWRQWSWPHCFVLCSLYLAMFDCFLKCAIFCLLCKAALLIAPSLPCRSIKAALWNISRRGELSTRPSTALRITPEVRTWRHIPTDDRQAKPTGGKTKTQHQSSLKTDGVLQTWDWLNSFVWKAHVFKKYVHNSAKVCHCAAL